MNDAQPFDLDSMLLPEKSIPSEIRKRLSPYLFETITPSQQLEYENNGWILERKLKRSIIMRRTKQHDVAFEDRVWAATAKLDFKKLNRNRQFHLPYGSAVGDRKQIDIFAADDEVVLLIECKSSQTPITSSFKQEIEAMQGMRAGLIRTIRDQFPSHKIKFILATNNFSVTEATIQRIESSEMAYMDDDIVDYYLELAEHLGRAARFQLLGSLFAGSKIPGLEPKVAAIQGKMGGYSYYSFAIEPARLLKMAYILHRNKANSQLMPTYQRLIKKTRLKKVAQFVDEGGFFPNSIIINIETGSRGIKFDRVSAPDTEAKLGILHLPQTYRAAYVIDGQHRLYGYADSTRSQSDLIPVVAFVGLPRSEQVHLFMQINENQQAVPKNLRNTLNADLLWESSDLREQIRALKLRIAQHLEDHKTSPLRGRIIIGEDKGSALRCITIDSISEGLDRGNFIGSFTKFAMREPGTFYKGGNEPTFRALAPFLELCFEFIRDSLPLQWELGKAEGGFVFVNNGIVGLLRVFSDIVDLVCKGTVNPRIDTAEKVFDEVRVYLDPLVEYLRGVPHEEALGLKRLYGSAGRARYWRKLQIAIHEATPTFNPDGLTGYLQDEAKAFNTESFAMIRDIEMFLKTDVRRRLEDHFGPRWFKDGVPLKVYQSAISLAAEKNREKDSDEEVEPWDCLVLTDYQQIFQHNYQLWQELFEKQYTRPGEESTKGGWKARTSWMSKLITIRNSNAHTYSVQESEYDFLVAVHTWLGLDKSGTS